MVPRPGSWFDAWVAAAYGPTGFWQMSTPAGHFRTASSSGPELAQAVLALLDAHPELDRVLEVGAGDGALLSALHRQRPSLALAGADLRSRPAGLAPAIAWAQDLWEVRAGGWTTGEVDRLLREQGRPTLLLAVEWLDDLPCRIAGRVGGEWHELDGGLVPGALLAAEELSWAATWWPDGDRLEAGTTRDQAWASLIRSLQPAGGQALMVDYGHELDSRPACGSLAGYRAGRPVPPVALPDRNLTAHVAVDAVAAAGEHAGARTVVCARQSELLEVLLPPSAPSQDALADLAGRSRRAALSSARGWGGYWWLLQEVPQPL